MTCDGAVHISVSVLAAHSRRRLHGAACANVTRVTGRNARLLPHRRSARAIAGRAKAIGVEVVEPTSANPCEYVRVLRRRGGYKPAVENDAVSSEAAPPDHTNRDPVQAHDAIRVSDRPCQHEEPAIRAVGTDARREQPPLRLPALLVVQPDFLRHDGAHPCRVRRCRSASCANRLRGGSR